MLPRLLLGIGQQHTTVAVRFGARSGKGDMHPGWAQNASTTQQYQITT